MPKIDPRKLRPLFDAVYEMNAARDHPDFMSAVAAGLARLVPADLCVMHVLDRTNGRIVHTMVPADPFTPEEIAYYQAHSDEHPLVAYYERTGDQRARRMSDVLAAAAWRKTAYYQNTLARLRFFYMLGLPVTINAATVAAIAFNRVRSDFTRRDCALLDAFAPHFRLAWQRHPDPWAREHTPAPTARERLRGLGLTAREAEVLYWMTEGKQNREIAKILNLSLLTVQKHVAHLVAKLEQENRHSATVHALRWLQRA